MSSPVPGDAEVLAATLPRRGLSARQAEMVERLLDAAASVLDEASYDDVTVRIVSARAGVSAATAYTYFSSKEHLFSALFWRHVVGAARPELHGTPVARLQQTVRHLAEVIGGSPALAAAATKSLLANDPDVDQLRRRLGRHWHELFATALGDSAEPAVLRTLVLAFSGALLEAGVGVGSYGDLGEQLDAVVSVVARGDA